MLYLKSTWKHLQAKLKHLIAKLSLECSDRGAQEPGDSRAQEPRTRGVWSLGTLSVGVVAESLFLSEIYYHCMFGTNDTFSRRNGAKKQINDRAVVEST